MRHPQNGWSEDKWWETSMDLPHGKTCSDCVHLDRCVHLFGIFPTNRWCDFSPSLFSQKAESNKKAEV